MNEFTVRMLWAVLQVTVLALVAVGLCAWSARQRPGSGAGLALAGLAGAVLLTAAAFMPMPARWSWLDAHPAAEAPSPVRSTQYSVRSTQTSGESTDPPAAAGWSLADVRRFLGQLAPSVSVQGHPAIGSYVAALFFAGVLGFIVRLGVGFLAVLRLRAAARLLDDAKLHDLVAGLCADMGCQRRVELRETNQLGGPVTVGWRRPAILLPAGWRDWGEGELRAVLAHELAHVCRADYAAWLLARLSVAVHFYHPLMHVLARRLHLQQELAADALGAEHAGGRGAYVKALARLALRQDERLYGGPARAFLPVRGTLTRRIAMLRTEEKGRDRGWTRPVAAAVLGCTVLAVSGLRGPVRADDVPATGAATKEASRARADRPPFVYCYCAPDAAGFFAFRPAVYFGSEPRMKPYADVVNGGLHEFLKQIGGPASFPKVEDIEQISGSVFAKYNPDAPKGQRGTILSSLFTLRTVHAYDWPKVLATIAKKVTAVPLEGHTYYKVAAADFKSPALTGLFADPMKPGDRTACFFQPDPRTLAIGSEEQFREMIRRGPTGRPDWATAAGWERVERSIFAVALTNHEQRFAKVWLSAQADEIPADVKDAFGRMEAMVLAFDHDGELRADLLIAPVDPPDARIATTVQDWIKKGRATLEEELKESHDADPRLLWVKKFLEQTSVRLEPGPLEKGATLIHFTGHVKTGLGELFEFLSGAKVEAVEVKK